MALYYLSATVGLAVSVHYCHGVIESIGVFTEAKGCCDDVDTCCSCCVEEEYVVKADVDDQLAVSNKYEFNLEDTSADVHLLWEDPADATETMPGTTRHTRPRASSTLKFIASTPRAAVTPRVFLSLQSKLSRRSVLLFQKPSQL